MKDKENIGCTLVSCVTGNSEYLHIECINIFASTVGTSNYRANGRMYETLLTTETVLCVQLRSISRVHVWKHYTPNFFSPKQTHVTKKLKCVTLARIVLKQAVALLVS